MQLLVVDDHPLVREGIASFFAHARPGTTVLQAADAVQGMTILDHEPGIAAVLLDLMLPGLDGLATIALFKRRRPTLPVLVLSSSEDPGDVRGALSHGASGYVPKSSSRETLLAALDLALAGGRFIPPFMLDAATARPGSVHELTARQREVLRLLCDGHANKQIGAALGMSERTVKVHVTAIFRALDVVNRTQAANAARAAGLLR